MKRVIHEIAHMREFGSKVMDIKTKIRKERSQWEMGDTWEEFSISHDGHKWELTVFQKVYEIPNPRNLSGMRTQHTVKCVKDSGFLPGAMKETLPMIDVTNLIIRQDGVEYKFQKTGTVRSGTRVEKEKSVFLPTMEPKPATLVRNRKSGKSSMVEGEVTLLGENGYVVFEPRAYGNATLVLDAKHIEYNSNTQRWEIPPGAPRDRIYNTKKGKIETVRELISEFHKKVG